MIPVNTPLLNGNEKKYLNEAIDTGWISSEGPFVSRFEKEFSSYIGRDFGTAVANGSAALDIAVKAIGITEGDEVIMPAFTIISPAFSVIRQNAVPVLVDADPVTWCMDVNQIEAKITKKTKAIIAVHIYGFPVDMDPLLEIADKYNLRVIEDAAEMHGQTYKNKMCGRFGDISIFSFYPNKHITTGEGGMLMIDDQTLDEKCKQLRNLSFLPHKRFVHEDIGWNYRMTNLQAALGIAQLEQIETFINRKREIGNLYHSYLENIHEFELMPKSTTYSENIYWVFGILMTKNSGLNAEAMMQKLGQHKIGTRPFFYPMHKQPVLLKRGLFKNEKYPVSEKLAEYGFYVPSGLGLTDDQIKTVAQAVNKIIS